MDWKEGESRRERRRHGLTNGPIPQGMSTGVGRSHHQENVEYLYASLKQVSAHSMSTLPLGVGPCCSARKE